MYCVRIKELAEEILCALVIIVSLMKEEPAVCQKLYMQKQGNSANPIRCVCSVVRL
jgi:hypothetical protein